MRMRSCIWKDGAATAGWRQRRQRRLCVRWGAAPRNASLGSHQAAFLAGRKGEAGRAHRQAARTRGRSRPLGPPAAGSVEPTCREKQLVNATLFRAKHISTIPLGWTLTSVAAMSHLGDDMLQFSCHVSFVSLLLELRRCSCTPPCQPPPPVRCCPARRSGGPSRDLLQPQQRTALLASKHCKLFLSTINACANVEQLSTAPSCAPRNCAPHKLHPFNFTACGLACRRGCPPRRPCALHCSSPSPCWQRGRGRLRCLGLPPAHVLQQAGGVRPAAGGLLALVLADLGAVLDAAAAQGAVAAAEARLHEAVRSEKVLLVWGEEAGAGGLRRCPAVAGSNCEPLQGSRQPPPGGPPCLDTRAGLSPRSSSAAAVCCCSVGTSLRRTARPGHASSSSAPPPPPPPLSVTRRRLVS